MEQDRWAEQFEERASLAGWGEAQQLHQLKLLLEKIASEYSRCFPEEAKASYSAAKAALKARFKSVNIEELRGVGFTVWCRARRL